MITYILFFTAFIAFIFSAINKIFSSSGKSSEGIISIITGLFFLRLKVFGFIFLFSILSIGWVYYAAKWARVSPVNEERSVKSSLEAPVIDLPRDKATPRKIEANKVVSLIGEDKRRYFLFQKNEDWVLSSKHPEDLSAEKELSSMVTLKYVSSENLRSVAGNQDQNKMSYLWDENGVAYILKKRSGKFLLYTVGHEDRKQSNGELAAVTAI